MELEKDGMVEGGRDGIEMSVVFPLAGLWYPIARSLECQKSVFVYSFLACHLSLPPVSLSLTITSSLGSAI